MKLLGHGIDVVDLERFRLLLQEKSGDFLCRCFTKGERDGSASRAEANQLESLAGKFAAKEAVAKALGSGFEDGIGPQHIEIVNDTSGAPGVILHESAAELATRIGISNWLISISHAGPVAMASALAFRS
jgi:holo-[acyl-carrier protein] synthase